ncbi:AAA family ATPase [Actinokineospora diospyrosa]|uniref:WD40 repeat n=1 Tax=Actinokineospora diospyrosa TaxID=103728 RepID=A0ABT1IEI9_9PSEU|nr:AAA family ATPase [Actinokineospora diospyrosa]MCP2271052.1 WD40 repeat [Actinokineospora diospyrosa]
MSSPSDLAADGARALVIGTATHSGSQAGSQTGSSLPDVASAAASATALAQRLSTVCGMPADRVRLLLNPASSLDIARAVTEEAARATTTLLVHYVGHGLRGPGGELYLAAANTGELTPGLAGHQAYSYLELRQALASASASSLVVVLDCCFSGRAKAGAPTLEGIFDSPPVHGFYLLGSAEQFALAPPEETFTTFTGELIRLLDNGDPRGGPSLTLDDAYDHLFQAMRTRGAPLPRRQEGGRAGRLVLAPNAAFTATSGPDGATPAEAADPPPPGRSPYPGLAPFAEEDARVFHGRGEVSDDLLDAVRERGLLVVVGASGSGKSSLVQAGLLPRVRRTLGWRCVSITPGERPLRRLATALGVTDGDAADEALVDPLKAAQWLPEGDRSVLVVVDQLEEMLTLCPSEDERAAFAEVLAVLGGTERAAVVGVLRADFYALATGYPALAETLRSRQFLVEPMGQEQLRAAIEEPARTAGVRLDEALPELILTELGATRRQGAEPGALPLMSHALWMTWRKGSGNRLTVRDYREVGGIGGAIARSAEDLLGSLDEAARDAVRRMLPRLVRVSDETVDTALRLDRADLVRGLPSEPATTALRALAHARLVTTEQDVVRISHEVLLTSWPLLRDWVEQDRRWLGTVQRLSADARSWSAAGRADSSLLYRGARLGGVVEQARDLDELDDDSAAFLRAATAQERRGRWLRRGAVIGLVVLLVAALVGAGLALSQSERNAEQARAADARTLVLTGDAVRGTDPRLALQLDVAAHRLAPGDASAAALVQTLTTSRYAGTLPEGSSPVSALALSPDGRTLAVGTRDGITLWDFTTPRDPRRRGDLITGSTGPVTAIAWRPDGNFLLAGDSKSLRVLDFTGAGAKQVAALPGFGSPVIGAAWSRDGTRFVVGNKTITVLVVAEQNGYRVAATIPRDDAFDAPRPLLSADGQTMITGSDQGEVLLWDLAEPTAPRQIGAPLVVGAPSSGRSTSVALSADNRVLAAGTSDAVVALWDVTDRTAPRALDQPAATGQSMGIVRLWFSRGDHVLVIADGRGAVTTMRFGGVADLTDVSQLPDVEPPFTTHSGELGDAAPDEPHGLMITGGDDGAVRLWQVDDTGQRPTQAAPPIRGHDSGSTAGSLTAVGGKVVSTATDGNLIVADVDAKGTVTARPAVRYQSGRVGGGSALGPDGHTFVTEGQRDGKPAVQLWDIPVAGPPVRLGDPVPVATLPTSFAWAEHGRLVVTGGYDGAVTVHDASGRATPELIASFTVQSTVNEVRVSDARSLLAVSTQNGVVEIRDFSDPRDPTVLSAVPTGQFGSRRGAIALSADGTMLAVGQFSGGIRLWSLANPREPELLTSWQSPGVGVISALGFSPTGAELVVSAPLSTRIWDITDKRLPRQLGVPLPTDVLTTSLAFLPDRGLLVTQGITGFDIWDVGMLARLRSSGPHTACDRLNGQGLSEKDWSRFLPAQPYQKTC